MGHACKINDTEFTALLKKVGNTYLPAEKPKKKLTLKQIFFLKKGKKY